jgi:hypothetical protein
LLSAFFIGGIIMDEERRLAMAAAIALDKSMSYESIRSYLEGSLINLASVAASAGESMLASDLKKAADRFAAEQQKEPS